MTNWTIRNYYKDLALRDIVYMSQDGNKHVLYQQNIKGIWHFITFQKFDAVFQTASEKIINKLNLSKIS